VIIYGYLILHFIWYLDQRPISSKIPAAKARIAITTGKPEKLKWNNSVAPVKMNQIATNNMPKFLPILMRVSSLLQVEIERSSIAAMT
jgi:hypothetical protein